VSREEFYTEGLYFGFVRGKEGRKPQTFKRGLRMYGLGKLDEGQSVLI